MILTGRCFRLHLANRALLTLSLDCDIYAFAKGFVIVWFCYTHCFSFKLGGDGVIISRLPVEPVPAVHYWEVK